MLVYDGKDVEEMRRSERRCSSLKTRYKAAMSKLLGDTTRVDDTGQGLKVNRSTPVS